MAARRCHVDMVGLRRHFILGSFIWDFINRIGYCWVLNLIDFVITLTCYFGINMLMIIAYSDFMSII